MGTIFPAGDLDRVSAKACVCKEEEEEGVSNVDMTHKM